MIELPLKGQSTTLPETRYKKGLELEKAIVGFDLVDKLYAESPKNQIHIQKYLSANCFGDYYTRRGLDIKTSLHNWFYHVLTRIINFASQLPITINYRK